MPLFNPRQERFAQELANGHSAASAYELAGFKPNRHNAARLARADHIRARVTEILAGRNEMTRKATEMATERLSITKETILRELWDNAQKAKDAGQIGPSNRALELLGKELGMFIDRKEISARRGVNDMTDAELMEIIQLAATDSPPNKELH